MATSHVDRRLLALWQGLDINHAHAEHVATLSDILFARTTHLHGLTKTCRPLMAATALFHDILREDGKGNHHIRGAQKLRTLRMPSVSSRQRRIMAQAVELHSRRSDLAPFLKRVSDSTCCVDLQVAGRIAAILRIADGLDNSRDQETDVTAAVDEGKAVRIHVTPGQTSRANARLAMEKADLWNRLALRPIRALIATQAPQCADSLVRPGDSLAQGARRIFRRQFEQLVSREYGVDCLEDPEYVHEMRVATRRLRAGIRGFGRQLDGKMPALRKKLSALANSLGKARDTDVFLLFLRDHRQHIAPQHREVFQRIVRGAQRRRRNCYRSLATVLASDTWAEFKETFGRLVLQPVGASGAIASAGGRASKPIVREARRSLRRQWDKVTMYKRQLGKYSARKQHRLRIDIKRLRYLMEFFADLYPPEITEVLATCVRLQDLLGDAHDTLVFADRLEDHLGAAGGAEAKELLAAMRKRLRSERRGYVRKADRLWRSVTSVKARRRVEELIASPVAGA